MRYKKGGGGNVINEKDILILMYVLIQSSAGDTKYIDIELIKQISPETIKQILLLFGTNNSTCPYDRYINKNDDLKLIYLSDNLGTWLWTEPNHTVYNECKKTTTTYSDLLTNLKKIANIVNTVKNSEKNEIMNSIITASTINSITKNQYINTYLQNIQVFLNSQSLSSFSSSLPSPPLSSSSSSSLPSPPLSSSSSSSLPSPPSSPTSSSPLPSPPLSSSSSSLPSPPSSPTSSSPPSSPTSSSPPSSPSLSIKGIKFYKMFKEIPINNANNFIILFINRKYKIRVFKIQNENTIFYLMRMITTDIKINDKMHHIDFRNINITKEESICNYNFFLPVVYFKFTNKNSSEQSLQDFYVHNLDISKLNIDNPTMYEILPITDEDITKFKNQFGVTGGSNKYIQLYHKYLTYLKR